MTFEPSPSASLPERLQPTSTSGKGSDREVPGITPLLRRDVPPRSVNVAAYLRPFENPVSEIPRV